MSSLFSYFWILATNTCTYYLDADSDPYDSDIDLVPLRSKRDVQRTGHVRPDTSSHAAAEAAASATSSDSTVVVNTLMTSIASSPTTTPTPAAVGSSSPASATAKSSTQAASQKNEGTIDEDDIEKILDEVDIPEANITDKIKKEKEYKSETVSALWLFYLCQSFFHCTLAKEFNCPRIQYLTELNLFYYIRRPGIQFFPHKTQFFIKYKLQ